MAWMRSGLTLSIKARSLCDAWRIVSGPNHCRITVRRPKVLDEALPGSLPTDEVLLKLLQRKATIESELEDLKIRRQFLTRPEYAKEFERLMIELAQVSHDIRQRTKS